MSEANQAHAPFIMWHEDDFTILGHGKDLDWFQDVIRRKFDIKVRGRIGPEKGGQKNMRILNRIVEWTEEGINYEADQRHAEIHPYHSLITCRKNSSLSPSLRHLRQPLLLDHGRRQSVLLGQ